jgi:hypothetical protein
LEQVYKLSSTLSNMPLIKSETWKVNGEKGLINLYQQQT